MKTLFAVIFFTVSGLGSGLATPSLAQKTKTAPISSDTIQQTAVWENNFTDGRLCHLSSVIKSGAKSYQNDTVISVIDRTKALTGIKFVVAPPFLKNKRSAMPGARNHKLAASFRQNTVQYLGKYKKTVGKRWYELKLQATPKPGDSKLQVPKWDSCRIYIADAKTGKMTKYIGKVDIRTKNVSEGRSGLCQIVPTDTEMPELITAKRIRMEVMFDYQPWLASQTGKDCWIYAANPDKVKACEAKAKQAKKSKMLKIYYEAEFALQWPIAVQKQIHANKMAVYQEYKANTCKPLEPGK